MFNDSGNSPKVITNTIGVSPGTAPTKRVTRLGDRGSSWASEQLEQPPTFRIGIGQKAQFVTGTASAVARSRTNMDPRIIPELTKQYISDMYGNNELRYAPSKKEVLALKSKQLSSGRANNMSEPLIQGGAFGARTNQETAMQKRKLKNWDEDHNTEDKALPGVDVRTFS